MLESVYKVSCQIVFPTCFKSELVTVNYYKLCALWLCQPFGKSVYIAICSYSE